MTIVLEALPAHAAFTAMEKNSDAGLRIAFQKCCGLLREWERKIVNDRFQRNITPEKTREIIRSGFNILSYPAEVKQYAPVLPPSQM